MLFSNCLKILTGIYDNDELVRVKDATGTYESEVLNISNVDYSQFKPRGYYEQNEEMSKYFKAVQDISMAQPTREQWQEFLKNKSVVSMLKKWIDSYMPFIPPSVYKNRPIFYSLGNFIFDQKYNETKDGLIAVCNLKDGKAGFDVYRVKTPFNSTLPEMVVKEDTYEEVLKNAGFKIKREILKYWDIEVHFEADRNNKIYLRLIRERKEIWRSSDMHVLSAYKSSLRPKLDNDVLILIENYFSTMDNENAPRPYIYEVKEHGLSALWRGSALAWSLIDICIFNSRENDYMGAFHRGDNFIELNPETQKRRIAFYTWNGFGFNINEDIPEIIEEEAKRRWRQ